MFVAIGHTPATATFKGQIGTDLDGDIITKSGTTETFVPGFFGAGDVQDKIYRQSVTAADTGCLAALEAEKSLANVPVHVTEIADVAGLAPASIVQPSVVN